MATIDRGFDRVGFDRIDELCINTIRTLSIDCVQKANSGHPGLPLGAAPMAYVLWQKHLKHNPRNPKWADRDRFVLSAGHGSMLLYSLLHLSGYNLSLDELKNFRQWGSLTPGHPEYHLTPGVEATTGPLGQGTANAVGMAIAERALANAFNRPGHMIVDHHTYALVSDGDLMEGLSAEAASLAGHLKLGKLIYLYDSNDITLDGRADITFTEDLAKRYEAYGWQVLTVKNGNTDLVSLDEALTAAKKETSKPSIIIVKTIIGFGSPGKQGTASAHGSPLGPDEVKLTKKALGWDPEKSFYIPEEAQHRFKDQIDQGSKSEKTWNEKFEAYTKAYPDLAQAWKEAQAGELPKNWQSALPSFKAGESLATREASGKVMNAIATTLPLLIGGDADLSCSTNTFLKDQGSFDGQTGRGRNIHYGVREHAMASIANGIAYHGGVRNFTATFFCFADYMRPAIRLAAMNHLPVIYVFTHDSIGLGEDGPTHQPVEHLASLRAIPNLWVLRPGDANETTEAWRLALTRTDGPVALVLSRQKWAALDRTTLAPASETARGAYILKDATSKAPQAVLIATGSEVPLALQTQTELEKRGVATRVVSMPSWELFEKQPESYRSLVLPAQALKASIEAGVTFGWSRYVGDQGLSFGINRFGASAPANVIFDQLGFKASHIADEVAKKLAKN